VSIRKRRLWNDQTIRGSAWGHEVAEAFGGDLVGTAVDQGDVAFAIVQPVCPFYVGHVCNLQQPWPDRGSKQRKIPIPCNDVKVNAAFLCFLMQRFIWE
jgi:hypothetical protein